MRVCIIYPPALFGEISRNNTEHIGIEYINATLNSANISSTTVQCDSEGITINELYTILQNEKYDVVGLSVYFYNYISAVKISKYISKNLPDTFIIWGGYLPTLSYLKLKKDFNYVDCMIVGEGEHVFMNIVTALSSGINWRNEKGIVYKDEAKIVFTGPSKLINNLDQLPFPHHTNGNDTAIILTSRGCYANCSFCAHFMQSKRVVLLDIGVRKMLRWKFAKLLPIIPM